MKVFKFGGASVKDAGSVKNLQKIVSEFAQSNKLIVVISAMGKSTNKLEELHKLAFEGKDYSTSYNEFIQYHEDIIKGLMPQSTPDIIELFDELKSKLGKVKDKNNFNHSYDQIISIGELLSTRIVSEYLNQQNLKNSWLDARKVIHTNNNWREGKVNWDFTKTFSKMFIEELFKTVDIVIIQGFIGSEPDGYTTTLGREGSDYTAAILAHCTNAESVTVWKDVEGILSADPKKIPNAQKFEELTYREVVEMSYYGATVIHPKTLKPLADKNIPLNVKSFINTTKKGTVISNNPNDNKITSYIFKENQCLMTFSNSDMDFIAEENVSEILIYMQKHNLKTNLMQTAATSFSLCIDFDEQSILNIVEELGKKYKIYYNANLTLLTVKNIQKDTEYYIPVTYKEVLMEQKTRKNRRILYN